MSNPSGRKTKDMNFQNAKEMRKNPTQEEMILWEELRDRKTVGLKFRRQHPVANYIADFYCHELKVIIELDGKQHNTREAIVYDEKRTADLKRFGITVYRITNEEFKNQNLAIENLRQILMTLKGSLSIESVSTFLLPWEKVVEDRMRPERAGVRL